MLLRENRKKQLDAILFLILKYLPKNTFGLMRPN
jgi:hypothetical protein